MTDATAFSRLLSRLVRGDPRRRTRLHDLQGNRMPWACLPDLVPSVLPTLAYKLGQRQIRPSLPYPALRRLRSLLDPGGQCWSSDPAAPRSGWRSIRRVVSIQHDAHWFEAACRELARCRLTKVDQRLCPNPEAYVAVGGYTLGAFDLTVVDGHWRDRAAEKAMVATRSGGWIYLDNSDAPDPAHRAAVETLLAGAAASEKLVGLAPTQIATSQGLLVRVQ